MGAKRRNTKKFTNIGTVLHDILPQYRSMAPPALLAVWEVWERAVGAEIAANARPAAFKGDMLLIHVASSTWLHHLRYMQKDLINRINQAMDGQSVRELKFKIGPI